ncbi:MAG: YhfC family intramembrane metalloprotease [Oscillospiraceae bacterium]|nr:YhfC family intramembrane metalloprotease [Oscillospiraceae bacterium]
MIPASVILACWITLFLSLVLPLLLLVFFAIKWRKQGILSAWLLGAAGFFVTQILIRLPILTTLQSQSWFLSFAQNHVFFYVFSLAFTAGLFELAGRFAVAKLMGRKLTRNRALAAGLGHGGIEAIILVGITYINNLAYIAAINSGSFDVLMAQTSAAGADISQLELIRSQLLGTSASLFLLAGFERVLAMTGHLAMSLLVCYGVAHKKVLPCLLLCLGIHTLMDLTAGLSLVLAQPLVYPIIYTILVIMAVISIWVIRKLCRRWKKEDFYDPEK